MPTKEEVFDYLGIDEPDEMIINNIERAIKTSDIYLKGALGSTYPVHDPRAKELALIVIADLYENRGMSEKVSGNLRKLVNDFMLQLRIEAGRSSEGV